MQVFWNDLLNGERYALLYTAIAYFSLMGSVGIISCLRIRRWPHTKGTLTEDGISATVGSPADRMHAARVQYDYTVDGIPYSGRRLSPFIVRATGTSMAEWQKLGIERHGGDRISVFYDPARPYKSYLIVPSLTGILTMFLLIMIAVIVLWFAL